MIISIGTDLVEIDRIESALRERGERFERRIYTQGEIDYCRRRAAFLNSGTSKNARISSIADRPRVPRGHAEGGDRRKVGIFRGAHSFAARFAAKEAVMKALGTGWRKGVRWIDIEVVRAPGEAPQIRLHGKTAKIAEEKGIAAWHLSLTHTDQNAFAFVVAEGQARK